MHERGAPADSGIPRGQQGGYVRERCTPTRVLGRLCTGCTTTIPGIPKGVLPPSRVYLRCTIPSLLSYLRCTIPSLLSYLRCTSEWSTIGCTSGWSPLGCTSVCTALPWCVPQCVPLSHGVYLGVHRGYPCWVYIGWYPCWVYLRVIPPSLGVPQGYTSVFGRMGLFLPPGMGRMWAILASRDGFILTAFELKVHIWDQECEPS